MIAHEISHHGQNLLGIFGNMEAARQRMSVTEHSKRSVKLELQAD